MAVNSKNVFVGVPDQITTGAILTGPETDTIPASVDVWTAPVGAKDSGYVSEDGITITPSESSEAIKDWSLKTIRKVLTEFEGTIAWTHLELSAEAARNYFGTANVTVTAATSTKGTLTKMALTAGSLPTQAWYFKIKDGPRRVLVMVPHGQITERGEIPINASGAITLPVTLSTYPDTAGNSIYIFTDDGVFSA